jgi:hypothetical protein
VCQQSAYGISTPVINIVISDIYLTIIRNELSFPPKGVSD